MPDMSAFMTAMKKQAVKAMESTNPVNLLYGTVIKASPLQIMTDQQMTLGPAQLVLARSVTDYSLQVSMSWSTSKESGGSGESAFASHSHSISGGTMTVHGGLSVGERVILIRKQEGQEYLVLDRVVGV